MKRFDFFKKEKDTLYRIQNAIMDAPDMNKEILKELTRQLGYPLKTEDYRFNVINDYIGFWWDYVGQWAWEQKDLRGKITKEIANEIVANLSKEMKYAEYPDEGLIFTNQIRPSDGNNLTYWAEVKYYVGKNSLWPAIIQLDEFGKIDIGFDKAKIGFAFRQEDK